MKKTNTVKRVVAILLVIVLVFGMCLQFAFASQVAIAKSQFQGGITTAYRVLRRIALAGGALALTGCGVMMLMGSGKDAEKAKGAIKYIAIAVVGVLILPLVVNFGKGMFGGGWDPRSLG